MQTLWVLARLAVLGYVGYLVVVFLLQRVMVFPGAALEPPRAATDPPPAGIERTWLNASSGRVEAWLLEASPSSPTVIFAHGNAELIDDWGVPMERFRQAGVSVLLVELPGYGRSEGRPSRRTIKDAFEKAFDWLRDGPGRDGAPIVAMGRSLGGGAAADLALSRPVDALVLMSTFSSAADIAWRSFKVPSPVVRDDFDNQSAVRRYPGPVLLMHGIRDEVLPYRHAERIAAAREGLDVVPLACGHNDCLSVWPEAVDEVLDFLRRNELL
ncbi:MAG: alpha/beta hydrolase [Gemmatimonadota bacterium]|nr:alpha/beta hydrolase [Gemmatimonadota bacterium]